MLTSDLKAGTGGKRPELGSSSPAATIVGTQQQAVRLWTPVQGATGNRADLHRWDNLGITLSTSQRSLPDDSMADVKPPKASAKSSMPAAGTEQQPEGAPHKLKGQASPSAADADNGIGEDLSDFSPYQEAAQLIRQVANALESEPDPSKAVQLIRDFFMTLEGTFAYLPLPPGEEASYAIAQVVHMLEQEHPSRTSSMGSSGLAASAPSYNGSEDMLMTLPRPRGTATAHVLKHFVDPLEKQKMVQRTPSVVRALGLIKSVVTPVEFTPVRRRPMKGMSMIKKAITPLRSSSKLSNDSMP